MKKTLLIIMIMALLAAPGFAQQASIQKLKSIDAMQVLPSNQINMVEASGQVFFVTQNGRYVIKGDLYDMWSGGALVSSVAELNASSSKIDLDKIGIKMDDLFNLQYGNGPKTVTMFVSPGCGYCKKTLQEMISSDLAEKYTFNIIPLPFLGQKSQDSVKRLAAAALNNPADALNALVNDDYSSLAQKDGGDVEGIKRAMITAQILGINQVPVLLADNGTMLVGAPQNLTNWLQGVN